MSPRKWVRSSARPLELAGIDNTAKYKASPTYQTIWTIQASQYFGDTAKTDRQGHRHPS